MNPERFLTLIQKLRPTTLIWPILLAALLLGVLPATGSVEPIPAAPANLPPKSGQTTLTDLPLPTQFSISEAIGRDQSNYHLTPTADGFRAVSPNQTLTANFTLSGLDLRAGSDHWTLSLIAYGYSASAKRPGGDDDRLTPVEPASPQAQANRLEYQRGPLTEWYQHGPLGLQQGFTLAERPALSGLSKATPPPLTLALRLTGPGPASVAEDRRSLRLGNLSYAGLLAYDAAGQELPAWLELHGDRLLLQVDDRNAAYPILIDPWLQQAKLTASDVAAGDYFGSAVAASGDTVVVGVPSDDGQNDYTGSVYVFVKPQGGWAGAAATAKLTASDSMAGDEFGSAVAISGDTIVVGARGNDYRGNGSGAAYIFVRPTGGWVTTGAYTTKLIVSDGNVDDSFGSAVAASGDTVVAGAPYYDNQSYTDTGAAYIFVRPAGGWAAANPLNETAKLTNFSILAGSHFGSAVGISSGVVVVGQPDYSYGYAYVFLKPGEVWTTTKTYAASLVNSHSSKFGSAVAVSGDTIVVGAYGDNSQGAAYVYVKPNEGWANVSNYAAKLTASDRAINDYFGSAVAINGDTVAVGAYGDDNDRGANSGAAYVFVKPGGGWTTTIPLTQTAKLTASDGAKDDQFGSTVAIGGDAVVVGTPWDDDRGDYTGSAYIFTSIFSPPLTYLYLPIVVKPPAGALTFRNDSGSPVTVTLFNYGTRSFGAGQQTWNDIPVGIYDWAATGTCGGQSGTVGSKESGSNYRARITINANQTTTLNAEKGGKFSCGG